MHRDCFFFSLMRLDLDASRSLQECDHYITRAPSSSPIIRTIYKSNFHAELQPLRASLLFDFREYVNKKHIYIFLLNYEYELFH